MFLGTLTHVQHGWMLVGRKVIGDGRIAHHGKMIRNKMLPTWRVIVGRGTERGDAGEGHGVDIPGVKEETRGEAHPVGVAQ